MLHQSKLAVATLRNPHIVAKLEALCATLYSYFSRSPNRYLAFVKLVNEFDVSGNKILQKVSLNAEPCGRDSEEVQDFGGKHGCLQLRVGQEEPSLTLRL
jgi:hypothetical protein